MKAIVAGVTIKDNIELGLYYNQASRGYSEHGYIGLYSDKSILVIGRLVKLFCLKKYDELMCSPILGDETTADKIGCIEEAIEHGKAHDYNPTDVWHKYFIVDKFYPTNFRKATKNLILKSKFLIWQKCSVMKNALYRADYTRPYW